MNSGLEFGIEALERRKMMAVDLRLTGTTLRIDSDAASDVVAVSGLGDTPGEVQVVVNNAELQTFRNVKSIRANMRDGDDELHLSSINISGDVTVRMGNGTDRFDMDTTVGGVTRELFVGDDVHVDMGAGAGDVVDFRTVSRSDIGIVIGDDVRIRGASVVKLTGSGGPGANPEDIEIGDNLVVSTRSRDQLDGFFYNTNVGGRFRLRGGAAEDTVGFTDCLFAGRVSINVGAGDDTLALDGEVFFAPARFVGGSGTDALFGLDDGTFLAGFSEHGFERS